MAQMSTGTMNVRRYATIDQSNIRASTCVKYQGGESSLSEERFGLRVIGGVARVEISQAAVVVGNRRGRAAVRTGDGVARAERQGRAHHRK